nr:MAG TPA: hypothetical protein [Caudoviricetes sp.]
MFLPIYHPFKSYNKNPKASVFSSYVQLIISSNVCPLSK